MQEHFNAEIESLKNNLIKMASIVDEQVERVIEALETGKVELCQGVKSRDLEVDAYDNLIQAQCENILALFQPFAGDLRFIISAMMINNQLERCGDIAVNIAKRVKKTANNYPLIVEAQINEMGKQARKMLKDAINSFIYNDSKLAEAIMKEDEIVDQYNKQAFKFLVSKMQSNPDLIEPCSHLIVMTKHIERLADHATNIAEDLVFYVEAKIISHKKKLQKMERDKPDEES
ncbi:phosphate signaling complex protein PhoU [Melioribacter sp. OK-6-Me]|uniref:phosphate signaling complex protein PhoU n=1 Tax=unclassified Melioribacter TaxID=2627329 RepID=UPI003EDA6CF7